MQFRTSIQGNHNFGTRQLPMVAFSKNILLSKNMVEKAFRKTDRILSRDCKEASTNFG